MLFDFGDIENNYMCHQKEDVKLKMLEKDLTCDFKKPQDYPYMCPCANKKRSMCCTYSSNPWRPGAEATTRFHETDSTHRECLTRFPMKSRPQVLCNGSMAHFLTLVSLCLCAFITSQRKTSSTRAFELLLTHILTHLCKQEEKKRKT